MNKVLLIGNLTHDPELSETPSGVAVCKFSLAVKRDYTSQDGERQTDFFNNCTAWRGLGENIARYCKKGNKVSIVGSIQLRNYEDNQGVKRTAVDIIVNECEFLTEKSSEKTDQNQANRSPSAHSSPATQTSVFEEKERPTLKPMYDDDDIPF